jgi:rhomboid protease GluP
LAVGSAQADLIRDGAWWRTVTALTLHVDHGHLLGNLVAGVVFGLLVAQLLGSGLAWLAILLAGALGNAVNAALQAPDHTAVGAPTAVFGALGVVSGYTRQRRTIPWRGGLRRWAPLSAGILLLVYPGFGGERTDVGAHVAGFAVGAVLGWAVGALLGSCATRAAHPAALRRADVRPAFAGVAGCPL